MWAHSSNDQGNRHGLTDHLEATAQLAKSFAEPFGAGDLAWALGLLHDAGKARSDWQRRLQAVDGTARPVGVPHKRLGAQLAQPLAGVLAGCILGHHGGLVDMADLRCELGDHTDDHIEGAARDGLVAASQAVRSLLENPSVLVPASWSTESTCELGMRMVFSALVDADHLDTAAHFAGRSSPQIRPAVDMAELWRRFEARRTAMLAQRAPSSIDPIRQEVYEAAVRAAAGPTGVYRLPAPTGSGKTLSAGAFALQHAVRAHKQRVVVAVPFLTITEQNAAVYRQLLGDEMVLEHHSGVDFDAGGMSGFQMRAAAENWDAPFVVTTTIQLFESLFGRKPSRSRKLHRLANAVLVLDEVQALPLPVLPVILEGLKVLSQHFGTTVLLASATQPEFQALGPWRGLEVRDVVDNRVDLYRRLTRVRYEWRTAASGHGAAPSVADIADEVAAERQALVVVNKVAEARDLFRLVRERSGHLVRHLSARMTPAHRRAVLADVRAHLAAGLPVQLVSTQLVEAGVDLDFPVVFRALAPAESLQQAAGRANREGKLAEGGRVVVFEASEWKVPGFYKSAVGQTRHIFGPGCHPDDQEALARYYTGLYGGLNVENSARVTALRRSRANFDFQSVSDGPRRDGHRDSKMAFRMIDEDTVPVVVPLDAASHAELAHRLHGFEGETHLLDPADIPERVRRARAGEADRDDFRSLQAATVAFPRYVEERPAVRALLRPVVGDLQEWVGAYDADIGVDDGVAATDWVW